MQTLTRQTKDTFLSVKRTPIKHSQLTKTSTAALFLWKNTWLRKQKKSVHPTLTHETNMNTEQKVLTSAIRNLAHA